MSSGFLSSSDVAGLTQVYGKKICRNGQDEKYSDLLPLMKQLPLDEQAELFIDSDIGSIATNNLCDWMEIESNINVKKEW